MVEGEVEKADGYTVFTLQWTDIAVRVEYRANWLNMGHWHIQLRCNDRLPVTTTGYRSIFVTAERLNGEDDICAFVTDLLDEAATSKDWQDYLEDRRQLKLF